MLSDWDAPRVQALLRLMETQGKRTPANWASSTPRGSAAAVRYHGRPAVEVGLPQARDAILACCAAARREG